MANCTNLRLVDGGSEIKQGDFSSVFSFLLLDESKKVIDSLNEKVAVVVLKREDVVVFKKSVVVSENRVSFTIDRLLEKGVYSVEIFCDGFVFPSTDYVKIVVVKSAFSDESLRSLRNDFDNTEDTGVILDESLKNFFVDGMSFKDFYDWFLDFREKFNDNYIFESESLAGFYYYKLDAIIHSDKSNLNEEDNMLDLVYSKSDRDSILFYYNKLKEIKVIEKPDEIISSITYIYDRNKSVFYADGSYKLFMLPQNDESRDGNFYFAVKTRKLQSATWYLENNDNVASIYCNAKISPDVDAFYFGEYYKISEFNSNVGSCVVIKHDPRINQKGSFTVRAVTEDGETIDREFTVR